MKKAWERRREAKEARVLEVLASSDEPLARRTVMYRAEVSDAVVTRMVKMGILAIVAYEPPARGLPKHFAHPVIGISEGVRSLMRGGAAADFIETRAMSFSGKAAVSPPWKKGA